jgi:hypothetical protein
MTTPRAERPHLPGYGVDPATWHPLPWSWAASRLGPSRNYWLVTVSAEGRPHALPVWGVWDDAEHRFAFSCAPEARKARNLAANPSAVVAVEDTVECVSVEGRATRLVEPGRQEQWIERYLAKYQPLAEGLTGDFLRANALFELEPDRAFGVIEREEEFSVRPTRWVFG